MARPCARFSCPDCFRQFTSWGETMDHSREHENNPAALLANAAGNDAAPLDVALRLLEIKRRASQEISHQVEDAADVAGQEISDAADVAGQEISRRGNTKDIDLLVSEIDQMDKEKPKQRGAQGGNWGAKGQHIAKSSKKPAEDKTTAEGTSVDSGGQEDKTVNMALHSTHGKYPCVDCIRVFTSWQDLMDHCRKEHDPNIEALLTNVAGDVIYAALAPVVRRLCKETVRNYEVQIAAEKDCIQQGEVVAKSGVAKCLVCDFECDPKEFYDHLLHTHFMHASLDAAINRGAAQEIIPQAGDATDAAAQKIRRQKDKSHIQQVTTENTKGIDQLVREFEQMDKEKPQKTGAQGGKRGAKAKKNAKSSKKPSAEDKTTVEGKSVESSGQDDKTEASTDEVVEDKTNVEEVEAAEKEGDVSYILLKAMKKAHRRHLEAFSASSDVSARSLEKLKELALTLAFLCSDYEPLILKIAKAGIDYAFTDIHRYHSFLTSAVLTFASVLPKATFSQVYYYLKEHARKGKNLKGPSVWDLCLRFEEILIQKEENSLGVEEDEPETLADSPSANQIGWEEERGAYKYFSSLTYRKVEWVNEFQESRLPYDLTLEKSDGTVEFVVVKSTPDKEWFQLSLKELKFAMEKGAAYTIARVSKSDVGDFNLVTYQDLEKHLKTRMLKVVLYPTDDQTKVELKKVVENEDVSYILLKALQKAHRRHLEAFSASSDVSARSLVKLEELAGSLAFLCADFDPLILKIAKAGIDYAFTDIHRYHSFLTSAVLKFASVLPMATFSQVFHYLKEHLRKGNNLKGLNISDLCLKFEEVLNKKEQIFEEEDEPETLSANQIGREGEREAYEYFSLFRDRKVEWVNESKESGLPYDITLEEGDGTVEFVEVKSTAVPEREWFHLSLNELKFAMEKGAAYMVAHVSKSDDGYFNLITYEDIVKLLKSRKLTMVLYPAKILRGMC